MPCLVHYQCMALVICLALLLHLLISNQFTAVFDHFFLGTRTTGAAHGELLFSFMSNERISSITVLRVARRFLERRYGRAAIGRCSPVSMWCVA